MAQMQFVDAQRAGEVVERPLTVGWHIDLADLPIETVVEKAVGEIEKEFALEGLLQAMETHAVFEQAIDDEIANAVGVLGSRLDAVDLRTEGLATRTGGAVFSHREFDEGDFAESDIAHASSMGIFAPAKLATRWAREFLGSASFAKRPDACLSGFHACVPPGLVWSPP